LDVQNLPLYACALIVGAIGVYTDITTRKIPNKLTFPAALLGIILSCCWFAYNSNMGFWPAIMGGTIYSIGGWFTGVIPMSLIKIFLRQMGHGDTKLMAAVGTFVGPTTLAVIFLYYSFCYGAYAVFKIAPKLPWFQLLMSQEAGRAGISDAMPEVDLSEVNKARKELIPVAPFILGGTILGILLETPTLELMGFIK
jgi:prepilin peptidase CpaA